MLGLGSWQLFEDFLVTDAERASESDAWSSARSKRDLVTKPGCRVLRMFSTCWQKKSFEKIHPLTGTGKYPPSGRVVPVYDDIGPSCYSRSEILYHFIRFAGHGSQASQNRRNVTVVTGHRGLTAKIQNKWSQQRNFAIFRL